MHHHHHHQNQEMTLNRLITMQNHPCEQGKPVRKVAEVGLLELLLAAPLPTIESQGIEGGLVPPVMSMAVMSLAKVEAVPTV
jgi:hypothetical protein